MKKWVSSIEKGNFLKWFIENNRLKRTDARRVIEYIINHFPIIENVSFTEKQNQVYGKYPSLIRSFQNKKE